MIINLSNDITKAPGIQQTYLAAAVNQGASTSPVKNINGFNSQWAVQIGQTGEETAEILVLSGAPSGTVLSYGTSLGNTGGALRFGHALDTPIYQTHYDSFVILRSTTGTTGSPSAIGTTPITPDSLYTQFNDPTGAQGYAYQGQLYNSVTGDISGTSSWFVPGGPTFYSLQKIRGRVKDKLYAAGYINSDDTITDWINECLELLTNAAMKVNQGYLLGTAAYSYGTAGLGTVTDPLFKQPIKVEVATDGINFVNSTEIPVRQFSRDDYYSPLQPRHAWIGDTVFQILPYGQSGTINLTYSQRLAPLVNDTDELPQSLKAYSTAFVEYGLSVAYGLDQKDTQQQEHFEKYMSFKGDFINEITPRDLTGEKMINITEDISGMHDDIVMNMEYYI